MDRSAKIKIGNTEYDLVLTTRATKEIAARYGGLSNLGEKLSGAEHFEEALDEILWLIVLLANQGIAIHNYENPSDTKPELTVDTVELLTTPMDLTDFKDAITDALYKGTKRDVESEVDSKNAGNGQTA